MATQIEKFVEKIEQKILQKIEKAEEKIAGVYQTREFENLERWQSKRRGLLDALAIVQSEGIVAIVSAKSKRLPLGKNKGSICEYNEVDSDQGTRDLPAKK